MRTRSLNRQRQDRRDRSTVCEFAQDHPYCWICGRTYGLEVHHIAGRNHPLRNSPANLFRCCGMCHSGFTSGARPIVEALAYKRLCDPSGYDLATVCQIRGKCVATAEEVESVYSGLLMQFPQRLV